MLLGLGLSPDEARDAVRFSLGHTTTAGEIDVVDEVIEHLPPIMARARAHRA